MRPIYEVIYEAYIKGSKILHGDLIKECKNNSNKAQDITRKVSNNIKRMEMEQWWYAQVIMLHLKDLKCVATDKN